VTSTGTLGVVGDDVVADPLATALPTTPEPAEILRPARRLASRWSRCSAGARAQTDRLRPLGARPLAPVALWTVAAAAALATARGHVSGAPAAIGVTAALISLALLRGSLAGRLVAASAMVPVAFAATAPSISWVLAAALVGGVAATAERPLVARSQDLQRHLDWCRRREERAHVLVVLVPESVDGDRRGLLEAFRLTDSVAITHQRGQCEIHAVIDDHRLSRGGLERRVVAEVGARAQFGWAAFPEDGYTLEVLLECAASGLAVPDEQRVAGLGRFEPAHQPA
jgi:hypothetical protein